MKKIVICVLIIILLLTGCSEKNNKTLSNDNKARVVKKVDNNKDYVYITKFKNITSSYELDNIIINLDSDEVSTINLELKSFVLNNYKKLKVEGDNFLSGYYITYEYYVSDKYISVLQNYSNYIDGKPGDDRYNLYVVSIKDGKLFSKNDILKKYEYDDKKIFEMYTNKSNDIDKEYNIMNMKNDGYDLFINKDNKLVLLYYDVTDDELNKKELILD